MDGHRLRHCLSAHINTRHTVTLLSIITLGTFLNLDGVVILPFFPLSASYVVIIIHKNLKGFMAKIPCISPNDVHMYTAEDNSQSYEVVV